MATMNPAKLRPSEAVRLINSTPLHDVLNDRQLRRHRERAGFRISDDNGQSINLFKYAAWLREQLFIKQNTPVQTYEEKKNIISFFIRTLPSVEEFHLIGKRIIFSSQTILPVWNFTIPQRFFVFLQT